MTGVPAVTALVIALVMVNLVRLPPAGTAIVPLSVAEFKPYSMEVTGPALAGRMRLTWTASLAAVAVTFTGVGGGAAGWMAGVDSGDCADVPAALVAATL